MLERWQDVLSSVTSGTCQSSLRDRLPLRLRDSLRDDGWIFRDSTSSRYLPRVVLSIRLLSMGSRLSGGTASLRYADYSEWLPVFRRLNDRKLRLGEQF